MNDDPVLDSQDARDQGLAPPALVQLLLRMVQRGRDALSPKGRG